MQNEESPIVKLIRKKGRRQRPHSKGRPTRQNWKLNALMNFSLTEPRSEPLVKKIGKGGVGEKDSSVGLTEHDETGKGDICLS